MEIKHIVIIYLIGVALTYISFSLYLSEIVILSDSESSIWISEFSIWIAILWPISWLIWFLGYL